MIELKLLTVCTHFNYHSKLPDMLTPPSVSTLKLIFTMCRLNSSLLVSYFVLFIVIFFSLVPFPKLVTHTFYHIVCFLYANTYKLMVPPPLTTTNAHTSLNVLLPFLSHLLLTSERYQRTKGRIYSEKFNCYFLL